MSSFRSSPPLLRVGSPRRRRPRLRQRPCRVRSAEQEGGRLAAPRGRSRRRTRRDGRGARPFHRALTLVERESERVELWQVIGHVYALKYDGQAFWTAMEKAPGLGPDAQTQGRICSELSYQTATRANVWHSAPAPGVSTVDRACPRAHRGESLVSDGGWRCSFQALGRALGRHSTSRHVVWWSPTAQVGIQAPGKLVRGADRVERTLRSTSLRGCVAVPDPTRPFR